MKGKHKEVKKKIPTNIKLFAIYQTLIFLMFFLPTGVLYLEKHGLSFTQVMLLQATFSLAVVILEVPTGAIADKIGRKYTLAISALFGSIAYFIYYALPSMIWFFIGIILYSITYTLYSGASTAFVYDTLKENKMEGQFIKVWGRIWTIGIGSAGIALITGGVLAKYTSLSIPFLISVFTYLIAFIIALSFHEPKHFEKTREKEYFSIIKNSATFILKRKRLIFLCLLFGITIAIASITFWSYQPYLKLFHIDIKYFGPIFAGLALSAAIGAFRAHKIVDKIGHINAIMIAVLLTPLVLLFYDGKIFYIIYVFMLIHAFIYGLVTPLFEDYMNLFAPSNKRATILSLQNFNTRVFNALFSPLFGYVADAYSLKTAFLLMGGSIATINLVLFFLFKKSPPPEKEEQ